MFGKLLQQWREGREAWAGLRAFNALDRSAKRCVFYAETAADWAYLGPIVSALRDGGERVICVTSDRADPVLEGEDAFFVGFGGARTVLFRTIDADTFVMTLSDLETFHLKRSVNPVHYFYVFHSIASTQRVYREHAFDAYDTILCVGPHHFDEIRRTEDVYGLGRKRLLEHGYGRLDTLIADMNARSGKANAGETPNVLVAPSWGECSIVTHCLEPLLETLLDAGFNVTLRLHPMTRRHQPALADSLLAKHAAGGRFRFDPHINTTDSLLAADIMISEWSGAPLEYAFSRERPVVFIDTPPKVHNPNWERIGLPCLEADIREELGRVVTLEQLAVVPRAVRELLAETDEWAPRIRAVRERTVFNVGRSGKVAAEHIVNTLPAR